MKTTSISSQDLLRRMQSGPFPYILTLLHIVVGTYLVYVSPRSNIAFLILISSLLTLYALKMNTTFKVAVGVVLALVVMPVLGVRNIFYLEILFQICVFAALALGLNIVVGFAGLLDLGYVAFYAVGAYLWAFFGSQQFYVIPYAPARNRLTCPSFCLATYFICFCFWV
jgi:branched-chain amino acid transport system permease protein